MHSSLPSGDYKLVIKTDAGDEGGVIQKPSKPIKYLKVEPVGGAL